MRSARLLTFLLALVAGGCALCHGQGAVTETDRTHDSAEWMNIAAHLPDPATAEAATLERAGDVLRARRYPQDAVRFYIAAIARGGPVNALLKKTGIVCLEMQQVQVAHAYFQRAVRLDKRDPGAWNNLGASEYLLRNLHASIRDYRRAIKLDKNSAVYHSNLALVYFDDKDITAGRRELAQALDLDPDMLRRDSQNGDTARVLASTDYAQICFEMARIYAAQGNIDAMLDWLTKASERGYNVRKALDADAALRPMLANARVQVLLKNADTLRAGVKPPVKIPSLGPAQDSH